MGKGDARLVALQVYGPLGMNLREKMKWGCLCVVVDSFYRSDQGVPYCAEASHRIHPNDIIERVDGISMLNTSVAEVNAAIKRTIRDHKIGLQVRDKKYFTKQMAEDALNAPVRAKPVVPARPAGGGRGRARAAAKPAPAPRPAPAPKPRKPIATGRRGAPPVPTRNSFKQAAAPAPANAADREAQRELDRVRREAEENRRLAEAAQSELEELRAQLAGKVSFSGGGGGASPPSSSGKVRRGSIKKAAQASAKRRSAERAAPVPAPRRVSKPTRTAHEASGTIIAKYRISDLKTIQQVMFAASKKLTVAVLDAKGKPLGMEIQKLKVTNKRGERVKRIMIVGFYRDGSRVCEAEKSGQVEPDDEIKEINGEEVTSHTQAVAILKRLNEGGQVIVMSLKRRKRPGPSKLANKRLSVGRPKY